MTSGNDAHALFQTSRRIVVSFHVVRLACCGDTVDPHRSENDRISAITRVLHRHLSCAPLTLTLLRMLSSRGVMGHDDPISSVLLLTISSHPMLSSSSRHCSQAMVLSQSHANELTVGPNPVMCETPVTIFARIPECQDRMQLSDQEFSKTQALTCPLPPSLPTKLDRL